MDSSRFKFTLTLLALAMFVLFCATSILAQETTKTTEQTGQAQQEVSIHRGEVVYVSGNDLVVKDLDSGELKEFVVPDSARATVDGKEVSVHDLKPGMTLERTITTVTNPKLVTKVTTIQGQIWQVNPPRHVILRMPDGQNKEYRIPENQKFIVEGKEVDAFHLRQGQNVTATVITEVPVTEVSQNQTVTGTAPLAAPETPPMQGALLIDESFAEHAATPAPPQGGAMAQNAGEPEKTETATAENKPRLPQTGSALPLLTLLGLLLSGAGFAVSKLN